MIVLLSPGPFHKCVKSVNPERETRSIVSFGEIYTPSFDFSDSAPPRRAALRVSRYNGVDHTDVKSSAFDFDAAPLF